MAMKYIVLKVDEELWNIIKEKGYSWNEVIAYGLKLKEFLKGLE